MTYRVFATGGPYAPSTETEFSARKSAMIAKGAVDLDDALAFAQNFLKTGQEVWEIECPDGTSIRKDEVRKLIRERAAQLVGRPKVY
jgi:hypothetical protein